MLLIKKSKEPNSLTIYKKQSNAYYDGYKEKDDVRQALLEEQGYLCAYCMRRISIDKMKIEHYKPQSNCVDKEELDYNNMLGVCLGNSQERHRYEDLTCDSHRGNIELTINPLVKSTIELIKYKPDGIIYSDNEIINKDLNETLNLNCEQSLLRLNRQKALEALKKYLSTKQRSGMWKKEYLRKIKDKYSTYDEKGKLKEYSGIILCYLNDRIERG